MLQVCYNLKDFLQAPTTTLFFFCSCLMFGGGKTQQAYLKKYHPTNLMSCVNDFDTKCFTGYQYW